MLVAERKEVLHNPLPHRAARVIGPRCCPTQATQIGGRVEWGEGAR
jgi:hypothetical protein